MAGGEFGTLHAVKASKSLEVLRKAAPAVIEWADSGHIPSNLEVYFNYSVSISK